MLRWNDNDWENDFVLLFFPKKKVLQDESQEQKRDSHHDIHASDQGLSTWRPSAERVSCWVDFACL